jgi:hypothetical protein
MTSVPKAFGVAGGLLYALIATYPDAVTLQDGSGKSVYTAPVERLSGVPTVHCGADTSSSILIGLSGTAHAIP